MHEGRAGQGTTGQDQDVAWQHAARCSHRRARHDRAGQGNTGQGSPRQGNAEQGQGRAKSYVYGLSRPIAPDTALDSFPDDFWAFISAAAAAGAVPWSLV